MRGPSCAPDRPLSLALPGVDSRRDAGSQISALSEAREKSQSRDIRSPIATQSVGFRRGPQACRRSDRRRIAKPVPCYRWQRYKIHQDHRVQLRGARGQAHSLAQSARSSIRPATSVSFVGHKADGPRGGGDWRIRFMVRQRAVMGRGRESRPVANGWECSVVTATFPSPFGCVRSACVPGPVLEVEALRNRVRPDRHPLNTSMRSPMAECGRSSGVVIGKPGNEPLLIGTDRKKRRGCCTAEPGEGSEKAALSSASNAAQSYSTIGCVQCRLERGLRAPASPYRATPVAIGFPRLGHL